MTTIGLISVNGLDYPPVQQWYQPQLEYQQMPPQAFQNLQQMGPYGQHHQQNYGPRGTYPNTTPLPQDRQSQYHSGWCQPQSTDFIATVKTPRATSQSRETKFNPQRVDPNLPNTITSVQIPPTESQLSSTPKLRATPSPPPVEQQPERLVTKRQAKRIRHKQNRKVRKFKNRNVQC